MQRILFTQLSATKKYNHNH